MDDRDRRAPIALARHAPVAQAEHGGAGAPALALGAADDFGLGLFHGEAVQEIGIYEAAGADIGLVADAFGFVAFGGDHAPERPEESRGGKEWLRQCSSRG